MQIKATHNACGIFLLLALILPTNLTPFLIMLDPAGDAQHAGRRIDDCFERGLTLQFCEQLKKELEKKYAVQVALTRFPGDTLEPLQNANFANRLNVQLYISFHFYHEPEERPKIMLYHYVYNPVTDFWSLQSDALHFIRYEDAHKKNIQVTQKYGERLQIELSSQIQQADTMPILGLPFKPLLGITAPALGIEISLKTHQDWRNYITGMCQAIGSLIS